MNTLISICIPTYNRAAVLQKTVCALVTLPVFRDSEDIEVVISDNSSTDETQNVGLALERAGNGRVRYFRNEVNVYDRNFELALSRGSGEYLKLANDTLRFTNEGLAFLLSLVRAHRIDKPVLFLTNGSKAGETHSCASMDELMTRATYLSTWIGGFGVWREHFRAMPDFSRLSALKLTQVDALLREFSTVRRAVVGVKDFCEMAGVQAKGDYTVTQVFGENYARILRQYFEASLLSRRVFRREKFRIFYSVIIPSILFPNPCSRCARDGYVKHLLKEYWSVPLYWLCMPFAFAALLSEKGLSFLAPPSMR